MKFFITKQTALFISLDAIGHINSLIGIADRLKDEHNFRTIFLIPGPTNLRTIEAHGHELLVMMKDSAGKVICTDDSNLKFSDRTTINDSMEDIKDLINSEPIDAYYKMMGDKDGFMAIFKKNIVEKNETVSQVLREVNPNLVIADTWYLYPCIIKLKNIPWVYVCSAVPTFFLLPKTGQEFRQPAYMGLTLWNKEKRDELREKKPEIWNKILQDRAKILEFQLASIYEDEQFKKLYLDNGLEPLEAGPRGYFSPYLNIYQCAKEIDYDQEDDLFEYPARWFRCDRFIRKNVDEVNPEEANFWKDKLNEGMKGKKAMIYFSLGTIASGIEKLMQRYIDMLKTDTSRLYVMSTGVSGDTLKLSSENMIGSKYLPQTFFLQHASLAIIHGGNNSTTECLYYGVPMIVMPCYGDQFDNAQRIDDLGLGKRLRLASTTKDELFNTVDSILMDNSMKRKIKNISMNMQARDDLSKVSQMLKKLTNEKKLDDDYINKCRSDEFVL